MENHSDSDWYLVIDQGGTSSRALIINNQGQILAKAQSKVSSTIKNEQVEQSPNEIARSLFTVIEKAVAQIEENDRCRIKQAALVCQRSSCIAINSVTHHPISHIISWRDTRAKELLTKLPIELKRLFKITGLRPSPHFGASKFNWLLRNDNSVHLAAEHNQLKLLPLACFLSRAITNHLDYLVDPVSASRTMLLDLNDITWSRSLLKMFSIQQQWLPEIQPNKGFYGHISLEDLTIPLTYVNGDQSTAILAHGLTFNNQINVNWGTGAFVTRLLKQEQLQHFDVESGLLLSLVNNSESGNVYCLEGTCNGAGAAIDHFANYYELDLSKMGGSDLIISEATPLFLNTFGGAAAPFWRSDIEPKFIGSTSDLNQNLIAVMESVVFYTVMLVNLIKVSTTPCITLSGGLSNNSTLCQLLADTAMLPVKQFIAVESSALGCLVALNNDFSKNMTNSTSDNHYRIYHPKENETGQNRYMLWLSAMHEYLKV